MSIGDTLRDSSHDLADYIYNPYWESEDDPRLQTGLAVWAALRYVYPDPFLGLAGDPGISDAVAGDTTELEYHIEMFKKLVEARGETYDTDKERADWMALVAFIKAIDEHLTPLLPSIDWVVLPYREIAKEESKKH